MNVNKYVKDVILIVDDTPTNLEVLFKFLEDAGFQVLVADNGENAISIAEVACPDLILLDVLMSGINGFETCQRLKNNPATQDIPVIFLTALTEKMDKIKGLNLGAVDYITKPLEYQEVIARVNIHLRTRNLTKKLTEQNERLEVEIFERQCIEEELRSHSTALAEWNNRYQALIQAGGHILYDWNLHNNDIKYAGNVEQILGYSIPEILGGLDRWLELIHPEDRNLFNQEINYVLSTKRWTIVNDDEGKPKSILTVNSDITEKKQLEAQFLRAQRMESLGTLASGIAHDLNNALTPMMMTVQLLEAKLPDDKSQQWLAIMETNVKRAADLVKQVLWFSRGAEGNFKTLQVQHLISEIEKIIKQTFSKAIEINIDIPKQNLWNISGDATQLHQVLMNLCINARDAMPNNGILGISANNFWVDSYYARMNLDAKVGSYVMITVSDTGTGIPQEIIDRIFEPFFTTKEVGKGTGLGLSTVLGIIKSHNGFVNVISHVGQGTEFQVCLPVTQTIDTDNKQAGYHELPTGNGELILVVDDEDSIREICQTWLEKNGYKVIVASDGIEAIALYTQHQKEISVVLIDMIMPSMDGATTITILQKINPHLKIIAVSGLATNHEMIKTLGNKVKTFLSKPYTSNDLLKSLQMVINGK